MGIVMPVWNSNACVEHCAEVGKDLCGGRWNMFALGFLPVTASVPRPHLISHARRKHNADESTLPGATICYAGEGGSRTRLRLSLCAVLVLTPGPSLLLVQHVVYIQCNDVRIQDVPTVAQSSKYKYTGTLL